MVALNPDYAPAESASRSENRVGNFFVRGGDRVGFDQPASRIVIGEKYDGSTTMASEHSKFANGAVTAAMVHLFNHEGGANGRAKAFEARKNNHLRQIDEAMQNPELADLATSIDEGIEWTNSLDYDVNDRATVGQDIFANGQRYAVTSERVIDLVHVTGAANVKFGNVRGFALELRQLWNRGRVLRGNPSSSAFSPEDIPSNAFGVDARIRANRYGTTIGQEVVYGLNKEGFLGLSD